MDVNLEELDRIIERGTHAPLSESRCKETEQWHIREQQFAKRC
jgi:hypothetical protein